VPTVSNDLHYYYNLSIQDFDNFTYLDETRWLHQEIEGTSFVEASQGLEVISLEDTSSVTLSTNEERYIGDFDIQAAAIVEFSSDGYQGCTLSVGEIDLTLNSDFAVLSSHKESFVDRLHFPVQIIHFRIKRIGSRFTLFYRTHGTWHQTLTVFDEGVPHKVSASLKVFGRCHVRWLYFGADTGPNTLSIFNGLSFAYLIPAQAAFYQQELFYTYDITVGNDLFYTYDITVGNDLFYTYDITVGNDLFYTYDITVGNDLFYYTYDVLVLVNQDLFYTYDIFAGNDLFYTYTISSTIGTNFYYVYTIGTPSNSLHFSYDIPTIPAPSVTDVTITPSSPNTGDDLHLSYPYNYTSTSDTWFTVVVPGNGYVYGTEVVSTSVTVVPASPTPPLQVTIYPLRPVSGDLLYLVIKGSTDNVDYYEIQWYKDGVHQSQYSNTSLRIPSSVVQVGEVWTARVRAILTAGPSSEWVWNS